MQDFKPNSLVNFCTMHTLVLMISSHVIHLLFPIYVANHIDKFHTRFDELNSTIQETISNIIKYHIFVGKT